MCGRYATTRSAVDLSALFDAADETGGALAPDYNVAPTDPVPVVHGVASRRLSVARWGLSPAWEDRSRRPAAAGGQTGAPRPVRRPPARINARAETVASHPAFARAFRHRRCLVPADGWYEWRRSAGGRGKQAYFMTPRDGAVLAFAGICAVSPEVGLSCSVITTAALGRFAEVHDRMPLLLAPEVWARWLAEPADDLLEPPPAGLLEGLEIRPVGPAVGDVRNDGPGLIAPIAVTPGNDSAATSIDLTLF